MSIYLIKLHEIILYLIWVFYSYTGLYLTLRSVAIWWHLEKKLSKCPYKLRLKHVHERRDHTTTKLFKEMCFNPNHKIYHLIPNLDETDLGLQIKHNFNFPLCRAGLTIWQKGRASTGPVHYSVLMNLTAKMTQLKVTTMSQHGFIGIVHVLTLKISNCSGELSFSKLKICIHIWIIVKRIL